jgi:hypothetical protein
MYEKFHSWLPMFGPSWGQSEDLGSANVTGTWKRPTLNMADLQFLDIPWLIELGRLYAQLGREYCEPHGLPCSNKSNKPSGNTTPIGLHTTPAETPHEMPQAGVSSNTPSPEKFILRICFFSGPRPNWRQLTDPNYQYFEKQSDHRNCDNDLTKAHVAVVTYGWLDATVNADEKVRRAIIESEPEHDECKIPEMSLGPPRILRPISGIEVTTPEETTLPNNPAPPAHAIVPLSPILHGLSSSLLGANADKRQSEGVTLYSPLPPVTKDTGISNAITSAVPLVEITVGSQTLHPTYVPGPQPSLVLGTAIIALNGPAATINGKLVSLGPKGISVDKKISPIPQKILKLGQEISVALGAEEALIVQGSDNKNSIILGSSTITVTGPEYTAAGHTIQFPGSSVVVDGTSTYHFTPWPTAFATASTKVLASTTGSPDSSALFIPLTSTTTAIPVPGPAAASSDQPKPSSLVIPVTLSVLSFLLLAAILFGVCACRRLRQSREPLEHSRTNTMAELDINNSSVYQLDSQSIHEIASGSIYEAGSGRIASEVSSRRTWDELRGSITERVSVSSREYGSETSTICGEGTDNSNAVTRKNIE